MSHQEAHQACLEGPLWRESKPGSSIFTRLCHGQEASASFNQNVCDGHTELSMCLTFRYDGSGEDLVLRSKEAWRQIRRWHPESGIELSTGTEEEQTMTFVDFASRGTEGAIEEDQWLKETWEVIEAGNDPRIATWIDVATLTYRRKLPTAGKRSKMYLVLAPRQPSKPASPTDTVDDLDVQDHCFIWNVSHAVTDGFSFNNFFNTFLELVAGDKATSNAVNTVAIAERLPGTVLSAYVMKYQPKEADRRLSNEAAAEQTRLYQARMHESVVLRPRPDQAYRRHLTTCLLNRLSAIVSEKVILSLKRLAVPISVTYIGAASLILSIRRLFGTGVETGALLGLTRNARRWVHTDGAIRSGEESNALDAPIPMATDVVYLWVPFEGLELANPSSPVTAEHLVALSYRIRSALEPHLSSPHYISQHHLMAVAFIRALQSSQGPSREPEFGPQAPGFSPGGAWSIREHFPASQGSNGILQRKFLYQTGRQVSPSPWISMYAVSGRICFHLGFDEKYWTREDMKDLLRSTSDGVASIAAL
ncbi:hypothetical protein BCV69DRAFT_285162 [Microstroma glucosiphilum]|uniref:CoA-dependent acyltransferase n=1 Tax=Pseudomicrostroma glucosiphilum TaxID=1684307 RepID=A0A316TZY3_9BASI|nr:hypothetical protein BCV69DRAFT_285162 [Pseudomicrostroma glucosiphilum]PWN18540.1 hypothetical protein BCV69DRAFT_285162 [Pseudomicrostroma glucosiphilum]